MTPDLLLARLTYEPTDSAFLHRGDVDWPDGIIPTPDPAALKDSAKLPECDELVVTWTAAEWQALADVFTPTIDKRDWPKYVTNWSTFEPHLTGRSPAREARCLGQYMLVTIGGRRVLLFHSELHFATDDVTAPVVALWQQLIDEVHPSNITTTGTAGGIGTSTVLGDVFVVNGAKFNCTKAFKSKPWAQQYFGSQGVPGSIATGVHFNQAEKLMQVSYPYLQPIATRAARTVCGGDVETVDYFGFDDTDDSYGIVKDDGNAHTEEMDDATLPLALSQMTWYTEGGPAVPQWLSVRNASDPEVPSSIGTLEQQSKWASNIYERYGYWTTVNSAIVVALLIADRA